MNMKIMITGGMGFIGSHLCDNLVTDHEIVILTKSESKKINLKESLSKIQIENLDITNFSKLEKVILKHKPEIIIHLAGQTSHAKSFENPIYDIDINAKSTLCILETIRSNNLNCKFILGSTFIVIGKPTQLPVNEETPCFPTTIYGTNRLASENYCKIYHDVHGLDTIIFRITNSFGPREQYLTTKNAINHLIYKAFKGMEITIYNNGKFFRDLIYVDDVISAIKSIMLKGQSGNLYWISSNNKTWFYQLGEILEKLTDTPVVYIDPPQYTKQVDVGNFLVDNSKLCSLGWKPSIPLQNGIKKTLDYFQSLK
jgi:UDP-glucose 4-epimerase